MRIFFLSISLLIFSNWGYAQEQAKVKACFDGYRTAILNTDGKEALKWINKKTTDYYADMLAKALDADSMAVEKLNVVDKFTLLQLRLTLSAQEIMKMDGRSFFVYAVEKGMIGKASVEKVEMGNIEVNGNKANGQFLSGGKAAPFAFAFDKEKGGWKIDLTSLFPYSAQGLELMIENGEYEENDFLLRIMSSLVPEGKSLGMHLWHPMERSK